MKTKVNPPHKSKINGAQVASMLIGLLIAFGLIPPEWEEEALAAVAGLIPIFTIWARTFGTVPKFLPKIAIGVLASTLVVSQADASNCAPRVMVLAWVSGKLEQAPQTRAMSSTDLMVEPFADPDTGQWITIGTNPSGISCVLGLGAQFQTLPPPKAPEDGDPA